MVSTARARVKQSAGNLPADVTSFVGRRREVTFTKRLLAESPVVTLTGPGGVGKTRLALRVASNMRRSFRDKTWVVELEDLRDGSMVPDAVIEQLGIGGSTAGTDAITEHLKDKEMLLVLDNCEHVVEDVALLVDAITRWCPGVRILATSRQSLGVAGESTMVVPPLQVPDIEHLPPAEAWQQYSAVRMFVDRAKAVIPEFEVTPSNAPALMRLCYHLDGNPLAIELAAVRLRSLSLQQLDERLAERYDLLTEGRRSAPPRQRSLRALIDWSYELCSEQEQLVWARVSVFSGTFGLDAAEHVAGEGFSGSEVLRALHALVDKSVLMREEDDGEVRYRLPHPLREYGQDRLVEAGQYEATAERHRVWFTGLVDRFAAEWLGENQVDWVRRLQRDQGNLRLAMQTAVSNAKTADDALGMAAKLGQYWGIRGLTGEGRHWLNHALTITPADAPNRVRALRMSAWFALLQGEVRTAIPLVEQATVLATQRSDEVEKAHLALIRGMSELFTDQVQQADSTLSAVLPRFRRHQALGGELFALFGLGLARGLNGDYDTARELLNSCIEQTTARGELFWRSYALWATAVVNVLRDNTARAEASAKESLRMQRKLDNRLAIAFCFDTLAWTAHRHDRNERAARLFGAASRLWEAARTAPECYAPFAHAHSKFEHQVQEALGAEGFQEEFNRGHQLSLDQAVDYALEVKRHARARPARADNVHPMPLTRRERQIAELVAKGSTNKEIAEILVIAQRTVEGHVQNILTKLDFSSRAQIAGWVAGQRQGEESNAN
ncbi:ATP-binding protein [Saccharopolyspora rectivirgula]|uniref:ATP-binding protein n=1 Tax=Saccharopolyspora rectivirgula TaxID=28042 RepID=UPI00240A73CC|nr:LuxR C-terminal-related transcriptional regulator [Saccharopolyspora rectivirgula]